MHGLTIRKLDDTVDGEGLPGRLCAQDVLEFLPESRKSGFVERWPGAY